MLQSGLLVGDAMEVLSGFPVGGDQFVRSAWRTNFLFVVWTGIGLLRCCRKTEHTEIACYNLITVTY